MRRRTVLAAPLLVSASALAACGADAPDGVPDAPDGAEESLRGEPAPDREGTWLSGSSGFAVFDGSLADWRGRDVEVVGTWADTTDASVALYELQPGGPLAGWDGPMDIAVGAIGAGETWAAAAAGEYEERWTESLQALGALREGAASTYLRFAHESNGDWYDWSVDAGSAADFVTGWRRYRELQLEHLPSAELVFCVNSESVDTGIDWRETFPGAEHVDLVGVDHYNQYPFVETREGFEELLTARDEWGGPRGLGRHAEFAAEVGLPFAVCEWSSNAELGDSPVFMQEVHRFFSRYGGEGPGQMLYEVHFNVADFGSGKFAVYPQTAMPEAAETYRDLW